MTKTARYTIRANGGVWIRRLYRTCIWAVMLFGALSALGGLPSKAFAEARVRADFNGDGFDDLAISVRFEDIGSVPVAGGVNVIYGSASGLTSTGTQIWHQNSAGILDLAEENDAIGQNLTAGDFNNDGFDDLAIGVLAEDIGSLSGAGGVNVIYGSANRLTSTGNQFWSQNSAGILDSAEASDSFGSALTAGDFNNDGFHDLAIGVTGENVGSVSGAGGVNVIYGSANRLTSTGTQIWHQNSAGINDVAEQGDRLGSSLSN